MYFFHGDCLKCTNKVVGDLLKEGTSKESDAVKRVLGGHSIVSSQSEGKLTSLPIDKQISLLYDKFDDKTRMSIEEELSSLTDKKDIRAKLLEMKEDFFEHKVQELKADAKREGIDLSKVQKKRRNTTHIINV